MFVDPPKRSEQLLKYALIALTATLVIAVLAALFFFQKDSATIAPIPEPKTSTALVASSPEPQRTDFGKEIPSDFPSDIPIEKGIVPDQSYRLDYGDRKQTTLVFSSEKTVKENYDGYLGMLEKDGWSISNKYEGETVSSIYGTKGTIEINVTLNTDVSGSQVSVSALEQ